MVKVSVPYLPKGAENAILSHHIHTTWEGPFSCALQIKQRDVHNTKHGVHAQPTIKYNTIPYPNPLELEQLCFGLWGYSITQSGLTVHGHKIELRMQNMSESE